MVIENIIFDMDGIIIDSEQFWRKADISAFAKVGIEISPEEAQKAAGLRIDDLVYHRQMSYGFSDEIAKNLIRDIFDNAKSMINESGQAKPGVYQAIETFLKYDLTLALASSTPLSIIQLVLKKLNLDKDIFQVICSGEHEKYAKPHPAIYLTAMEQLKTSPFHCAAIEDSLNGVIAVKAAKIYCIAVPDPWHNHAKGYHIANEIIPSLEKIDKSFIEVLKRT